jgi:hypothetical protein
LAMVHRRKLKKARTMKKEKRQFIIFVYKGCNQALTYAGERL